MKPFEERTLFALTVRLKKAGSKELPASLVKLPAYLQKLIEEGVYVAAGEWTDNEGGLVLLRTTERKDAERLARSHPFYDKPFADVDLREWSARWALWNLMGAGKGINRRKLRKGAAKAESRQRSSKRTS